MYVYLKSEVETTQKNINVYQGLCKRLMILQKNKLAI